MIQDNMIIAPSMVQSITLRIPLVAQGYIHDPDVPLSKFCRVEAGTTEFTRHECPAHGVVYVMWDNEIFST